MPVGHTGTTPSPGPRRSHRTKAGGRAAGLAAVLLAGVALAACAPPGSGSAPAVDAGVGAVSTDVSKLSADLVLYDGAGLKPVDDALAAAFTKKYPKIKITGRYDPDDVQAQNAPRVLSSNTPPDIARIIALSDVVKNGQLANLDPYATAYAWNELPAGQRAQFQVTRAGVRGSGAEYTVASGFTVTGLYWNKKLAQQIGLTTPPRTVDELEAAMAKAKAAGIVPMIIGNQTGQGVFPIQMMINNAIGAIGVNNWVYHVPGATIDSAPAVAAVARVANWVKAGYFNKDANGTDATGAGGRFGRGEGLFYPSGNWDAATVSKALGDDVGFILPPAAEAGKSVAMSDPLSNFGIPAKSKNKDAAAAFLNFLLSPEARQIVADNGFAPNGSGAPPKVAAGVATEVQTAFAGLVAASGQAQFVQNATSGIAPVWNAQAQLLLAGKSTPKAALGKVQSQYTDELGG